MKKHEIYGYAGFSDEEIEKLEFERTLVDRSFSASLFCFNRESLQFEPIDTDPQNVEIIGNIDTNRAQYRANLFLIIDNLPYAVTELHKKKIPDEIIRATLSDISLWSRYYFREFRIVGYPSNKFCWFNHHFEGKLFRLGRLQYELTLLKFETELLQQGAPILKIHVPEDGKLIGEQCDESFLQAERFFGDTYPFSYQALILDSWLSDHDLLKLLPESSNIRKFAERFIPIEHTHVNDNEIYHRIFGEKAVLSGLVDYELKTSLQKIIYPYFKEKKLFGSGVGIILRNSPY
ncbi:MAG: DUF5596 domain-containing protein [Bacteroidetes bacterium]|nr:DUF5596 domain-containing protein [Bacteroidota bacterium]